MQQDAGNAITLRKMSPERPQLVHNAVSVAGDA